MTRLDRRTLFASGTAAALLAATGTSLAAKPARGGVLRAAIGGAQWAAGWDARQDWDTFMYAAAQGAVFDTLTEIGADGTLRGELATEWTGSPDARVWQVSLRKGVVFHDGTPFTAEDVVASYDLHRGSGSAGEAVISRVESLRATSDHAIEIVLKQDNSRLPMLLGHPHLVIYPANKLAHALETGIGTGLYRVERFRAGREFVGTRVDSHWRDGQAGWFDRVEFVAAEGPEVRADALSRGVVDVADLPEGAALSPSVLRPHAQGARLRLDDARLAERWWFNPTT